MNLVLATMLTALAASAHAGQKDIPGPEGSAAFGESVTVLPNGNFVVTDQNYTSPAGVLNVGAVYLYSPSGTLISTLTGSEANDKIGSGGVFALTNGNFVVCSPLWDGTSLDRGAVTWASGTLGVAGEVSAANSLVGSNALDQVGGATENPSFIIIPAVTVLTNGNYVVSTPFWDGAIGNIGAVTWCNGTTGTVGPVSVANSLVGSSVGDFIGDCGVFPLTNGNYVVSSENWQGVGAATWCNGSAGLVGTVSAANSLVGSTSGDRVSGGFFAAFGITALTNGNYVVRSPFWDGMATDTGAVTWCNGSTGTVGPVSAANSLVSTTAGSKVGSDAVCALTNGNYVVSSSMWNGVGAATWCNGSASTSAVVSAANSIVGSTMNDSVGSGGVTALSNGNYVVSSPLWDGMAADVGAATWGNGSTGTAVTVSAANSLVGSTANDAADGAGIAFLGVTALTNGNYVVFFPYWNGTAADVGAATWCNGSTGRAGLVSTANSLVGGTAGDALDSFGIHEMNVIALTNGNYVVSLPNWDGAAANVGAATWGNGTTGIVDPVSAANSLVGSTAGDRVSGNGLGRAGVVALANGNYVVCSPSWDGTNFDAGAATWASGASGIVGVISAQNSLVGVGADEVSGGGVTALTDGNYAVRSLARDGLEQNIGSVTLGRGASGTTGSIAATDSVLGTTEFGGFNQVFGYDVNRAHLVVGRPSDNIVTIFAKLEFTSPPTATPSTAGVGQPVLFSAGVTGDPSYSWEIAGTVVTGPNPIFAFPAAGIFNVQLTVTSSIGGTLTGSVTVTVNAPIVGSGKDSDGDGFSDDIEIAAGTDPNNPNDTPTGGAGTTPQALTQSKLAIKLNFAKPASDSISFSGTLPIADGFDVTNKTAIIDVGGVVKGVTLDAKGKAPKGNTAFAVAIKAKKGVVAAQTSKYSVKLSKGDFATALADEGLTSADAKNAPKSVVVRVIFGGAIYQQSQNMLYSAKAGKTGSAKAAK